MVIRYVIRLCEDIKKQVAEFQKYVDENISDDQTIILFFGSTGAGKSTLAALLTGRNVTVEKYNDRRCRLICTGSGIGSGGVSVESSLIIHKLSDSVSICEFPEFEGTRGEKEEILLAYQNFKLLGKKNGKNLKIKIVLVASDVEMRYKRGIAVKGMIDRIEKMFLNNSTIRNHINLAITGCDSLNFGENGYDTKLMNQFKRDNIFLFPEPKTEDDGKVYDIAKTDFGKLKSFIDDGDGYLNDYEVKLSLDDHSEALLIQTIKMEVEKSEEKLLDIRESFTSEIKEGFKNESEITKGIEYLRKQKETIAALREIDDPLTFVSRLLSNAKSENLKKVLNEAYDQFKSISTFYEFTDKALGSKNIRDRFDEVKNNECDNLIELLEVEIGKAEEEKAR